MPPTCMSCRQEILAKDLRARICAHTLEKEINPFFLPVVVSDPIHPSQHLCGHCAEGKDQCPCCKGPLTLTGIAIHMEIIYRMGKKYFEELGFSGKFRSVSIMENELLISYVAESGRSGEITWGKAKEIAARE